MPFIHSSQCSFELSLRNENEIYRFPSKPLGVCFQPKFSDGKIEHQFIELFQHLNRTETICSLTMLTYTHRIMKVDGEFDKKSKNICTIRYDCNNGHR